MPSSTRYGDSSYQDSAAAKSEEEVDGVNEGAPCEKAKTKEPAHVFASDRALKRKITQDKTFRDSLGDFRRPGKSYILTTETLFALHFENLRRKPSIHPPEYSLWTPYHRFMLS